MEHFAFLAEHAKLTDKPGEGPFARAFIVGDDNSISFCIQSETGGFKSVLYLIFDDSDTVREAFFSKGEPFNFDNWSQIQAAEHSDFVLPTESDSDTLAHAGATGKWPLSGIAVSCCEVIFAMKAMLNYSGIHRTLAAENQESISEISRRFWEEGKYRQVDPTIVGDVSYLKDVADRELNKMLSVIKDGNAEKMKKTGREFSSVFTFGSKPGQADLRLNGLPWHRVACALLYHLKLRLWLGRPGVCWLLTRLFGSALVREVSTSDTLYAVVLSRDPKPPGTSPVDPIAGGDAAAAAAAAGGIDDDWRNLDEERGNLLGKVCRAAVASLAQGSLLPDFGAPAAVLRQLGFGPLLLAPAEFERLAAAAAAAGPREDEAGAGKWGRARLVGLLRGLGVREISREDLAFVRLRRAAAP